MATEWTLYEKQASGAKAGPPAVSYNVTRGGVPSLYFNALAVKLAREVFGENPTVAIAIDRASRRAALLKRGSGWQLRTFTPGRSQLRQGVMRAKGLAAVGLAPGKYSLEAAVATVDGDSEPALVLLDVRLAEEGGDDG